MTSHGCARRSDMRDREAYLQAHLGCEALPERITLRGVVVAAHPDDEVIGVGARLPRWPDVHVVHVTDGAPRDMRDASALGLPSRDAYAAVRRAERDRALAMAGVTAARAHALGRVDQEAWHDLVGIAGDLLALLRATTPDVVVTHPYEGGHPDHDAAAFAVHAAVQLLEAWGTPRPAVVEMASYHCGTDGIATGSFLPCAHRTACASVLDDAAQERKRRMLACHVSQHDMLRPFRCDIEPIRIAPDYDFGAPPHAGLLFYERLGWGISGAAWRARARMALHVLALPRRGGHAA